MHSEEHSLVKNIVLFDFYPFLKYLAYKVSPIFCITESPPSLKIFSVDAGY